MTRQVSRRREHASRGAAGIETPRRPRGHRPETPTRRSVPLERLQPARSPRRPGAPGRPPATRRSCRGWASSSTSRSLRNRLVASLPVFVGFRARPGRGRRGSSTSSPGRCGDVLPPGQNLAYTTLTEPFMMYFRVALLGRDPPLLAGHPLAALALRLAGPLPPRKTLGLALRDLRRPLLPGGLRLLVLRRVPSRREVPRRRRDGRFRPSSRSTSTSRSRRS